MRTICVKGIAPVLILVTEPALSLFANLCHLVTSTTQQQRTYLHNRTPDLSPSAMVLTCSPVIEPIQSRTSFSRAGSH